jgi:hypothetical protein
MKPIFNAVAPVTAAPVGTAAARRIPGLAPFGLNR